MPTKITSFLFNLYQQELAQSCELIFTSYKEVVKLFLPTTSKLTITDPSVHTNIYLMLVSAYHIYKLFDDSPRRKNETDNIYAIRSRRTAYLSSFIDRSRLSSILSDKVRKLS